MFIATLLFFVIALSVASVEANNCAAGFLGNAFEYTFKKDDVYEFDECCRNLDSCFTHCIGEHPCEVLFKQCLEKKCRDKYVNSDADCPLAITKFMANSRSTFSKEYRKDCKEHLAHSGEL